ncbi:ferredoxin reductase [Luteipulveratus sp. YIM 133132]|uniref:ferredoxin reductase n=1 Tax=Luteipulveratus flavus TaxID=3031728 RepID=UPI0023AFB0B1|nr:ferredoxin reductase [Luteipulveratus sp. YIM 133132]MDE9364824.1 ferredoxin reductase [Luteipulveratus sp. YIM 133132]
MALSAASVFTAPRHPQDFLQLVNPLSSARQLRGVVTSVTPECSGSVTIAFRPGRGWHAHEAGQYARIGVEIDGVRQWRSYSLSAPAGQDPAITVTAVGRVSRHLVESTRVGDVLFLAPPQGDFLLPTGPRPLLMLTAGSGITPVMSMIRTLVPRRPDADVVLIHSARTPQDALFRAELATLAADHDGLHVVHRYTATDGRIDFTSPADLDALCPDWRSRKAYVCGPAELLDDASQMWHDHHVADALSVERFETALLADAGAGGRVVFEKSDKEAVADGSTTLLEAGEDAGVLMPHGCRMGICRSCLVPLRAGQIKDLRTGETHADEGELIQTCISAPCGTVHLDV